MWEQFESGYSKTRCQYDAIIFSMKRFGKPNEIVWLYEIKSNNKILKSGLNKSEIEAKEAADRELFLLCEEQESNEQTREHAAQLMDKLKKTDRNRV